MSELEATLRQTGQAHLWDHLQSLDPPHHAGFETQLRSVDFHHVQRIFQASITPDNEAEGEVSPVTGVDTLEGTSSDDREAWHAAGLRAIAAGQIGGLLLAGGQGSRLGSSAPKGCYDVGLPSRKSLFQLHAERLLRLQTLAAAEVAGAGEIANPIRWYIMTSPATDGPTREYFQQHGFFGLQQDQVFFFQQGMLPALTETGAAILETPGRLALSPDGNGGVYAALRASGALRDMAARGVRALDCWPVDNALARPLDPAWVGRCLASGSPLGCRVLPKAGPGEKVGVLAERGGKLTVLEYSELSAERAALRDPGAGSLVYRWSNACLHFFTHPWLESVCDALEGAPRYHVARKSIPTAGGASVPGVKLELFIFDTFHLAPTAAIVEVARAAEFAPVKNAPGSGVDCPETARDAVLALHAGWVRGAGGQVACDPGLEVSPLLSYAGEGLVSLCAGSKFDQPFSPRLQGVGAQA